jgi:hypothetical protein
MANKLHPPRAVGWNPAALAQAHSMACTISTLRPRLSVVHDACGGPTKTSALIDHGSRRVVAVVDTAADALFGRPVIFTIRKTCTRARRSIVVFAS